MKRIVISLLLLTVVGCSSKSKKDADIKDQALKTMHDKSEGIAGSATLGVNQDKELIVQEKIQLSEHLRELVNSVKMKQDELYGSKRFNTRGTYGKLEACVKRLNRQQKSTSLQPLATREIVLQDVELGQLEADKFGYDEGGRLVVLDETKLRDKIREMEGKKRRLYEKEEELIAELNRCEAQIPE